MLKEPCCCLLADVSGHRLEVQGRRALEAHVSLWACDVGMSSMAVGLRRRGSRGLRRIF